MALRSAKCAACDPNKSSESMGATRRRSRSACDTPVALPAECKKTSRLASCKFIAAHTALCAICEDDAPMSCAILRNHSNLIGSSTPGILMGSVGQSPWSYI